MMPSGALLRLSNRLAEIDQILAAHVATAGAGPGRKWGVSALNKGAIVLLSAHFEGFLEELYSEAVSAIINGRLSCSSVPEELRLTGILQLALDLRSGGNSQVSMHALRIMRKAARFGHPRSVFSKTDADTDGILRRFQNPRSDQIDELFETLGLKQVLSRLSWQGRSAVQVRGELDGLVNVRNQVAHGALTDVYKYQVRAYRAVVERVAERLDILVRNHVTTITTTPPWP